MTAIESYRSFARAIACKFCLLLLPPKWETCWMKITPTVTISVLNQLCIVYCISIFFLHLRSPTTKKWIWVFCCKLLLLLLPNEENASELLNSAPEAQLQVRIFQPRLQSLSVLWKNMCGDFCLGKYHEEGDANSTRSDRQMNWYHVRLLVFLQGKEVVMLHRPDHKTGSAVFN